MVVVPAVSDVRVTECVVTRFEFRALLLTYLVVLPYVICEFAGTAVVQVMVAVVVVWVAVTALIHDCAKADGATRKENRRGTDTKRTRINLHIVQYRNHPQPGRARGMRFIRFVRI